MILISFILCSALLLIIYRALFANEKILRFNRAYLLLALVFSMVVPFIRVTTKPGNPALVVQQIVQRENIAPPPTIADVMATGKNTQAQLPGPAAAKTVDPTIFNYWPEVICGLYGIVTLVLLARYLFNLYRITIATRKGKHVPYGNVTLVLTDTDAIPYNFLNYVFVSSTQYQNGQIEPQILCHEQAHARQRHTLDILFIELLQVLFWINPVIPFYRRAIQLNHEFMADDAVLQNHYDTPSYQMILLATSAQSNDLPMVSGFSYLTTKKRLIMMTKNTHPKIAIGKQLALVPVLAGALLLFSHKTMAFTEPSKVKAATALLPDSTKIKRAARLAPPIVWNEPGPNKNPDAPQAVLDEYLAIEKKYKFYRIPGAKPMLKAPHIADNDDARLRVLFGKMSRKQQLVQVIYYALYRMPHITNVSDKNFTDWKDAATYGIWIDDKRIKNDKLDQYKAQNIKLLYSSRLMPIAVKNDGFKYQLTLMTWNKLRQYSNDLNAQNDKGGFRTFRFNLLKNDPKLMDQLVTEIPADPTDGE